MAQAPNQAPQQPAEEGRPRAPSKLGESEKKFLEEFAKETSPLNEKEQKTLDLIKKELADDLKDAKLSGCMLTRFIRGYAMEAEPEKKTLEMLREALKWRKENNVDTVLESKIEKEELFAKMWPVGIVGHDKCGHPIYFERFGAVEPTEIEKNFTTEMIQKFHIKNMELLTQAKDKASEDLGKPVYKHLAIVDLEGFGVKHMGSRFTGPMQAMVHIDQYYYPESLSKLIVVNAPWVFRMLWAIVSPWIHPLTRERIKMGNQYLAEYIDDDQLPAFLRPKK